MKKILIVLLVLCCVPMAGAVTRTWTGGGGADANWTSSANWGGTAPVSGDTAHINIDCSTVINSAVQVGIIRTGYPATTADKTISLTVDSGGSLTTVAASTNNRYISLGYGGPSVNTLTVNSGGTLTTRLFGIGQSVGSGGALNLQGGTFNLEAPSYATTNEIRHGQGSGHNACIINITNGGLLNATANSTQTGDTEIKIGYYGGVGDEAVSQFNILNGTLRMNEGGTGATGIAKGQLLAVGYGADSDHAELNLSAGGTIEMATTISDGRELLAVGYGANSSGVFNMTGGTVNIPGKGSGNQQRIEVGYGVGSNGTFDLSGGDVHTPFLYVGDAGTGTLKLSGTGTITASGIRVGNNSDATRGTGIINMTGGTISNMTETSGGYLVVGYNRNDAVTTPDIMTISGGLVELNKFVIGQAGRGILTITGSDASITTNNFYVGNNGSTILNGIGTVKFQVGADGVSAIHARTAVFIDLGEEASVADLLVELTAAPPIGDILLIDNQSADVTNEFDTVNGIAALEGTQVTLSSGGNDYVYTLTYMGGQGGNDVMLIIPEPATLVMFAATGLVYFFKRRR